jgi:hypothetical protein
MNPSERSLAEIHSPPALHISKWHGILRHMPSTSQQIAIVLYRPATVDSFARKAVLSAGLRTISPGPSHILYPLAGKWLQGQLGEGSRAAQQQATGSGQQVAGWTRSATMLIEVEVLPGETPHGRTVHVQP